MSAEPTKPAPFAAAYVVDGVNLCAHATARCEPCMYGSHPGGKHSWAGVEDVLHAAKTGQPDPLEELCGCVCTNEPEVDHEPEPDFETFSDREPCPICGEHGACGYDAEGRPMIHTDWDDEDDA